MPCAAVPSPLFPSCLPEINMGGGKLYLAIPPPLSVSQTEANTNIRACVASAGAISGRGGVNLIAYCFYGLDVLPWLSTVHKIEQIWGPFSAAAAEGETVFPSSSTYVVGGQTGELCLPMSHSGFRNAIWNPALPVSMRWRCQHRPLAPRPPRLAVAK